MVTKIQKYEIMSRVSNFVTFALGIIKGGRIMSNLRAMADTGNGRSPIQTNIAETTAWKDFLALIKVGIVNSNMITTFTGLWLALHFTGMSFLGNLDLVFFALAGSVFIMAGSCSFNNYYDRDIDHLMERTKNRPTVTGKVSPSKVLTLSFLLIAIGLGLLALTNHNNSYHWICWGFCLYCLIYNDFET